MLNNFRTYLNTILRLPPISRPVLVVLRYDILDSVAVAVALRPRLPTIASKALCLVLQMGNNAVAFRRTYAAG